MEDLPEVIYQSAHNPRSALRKTPFVTTQVEVAERPTVKGLPGSSTHHTHKWFSLEPPQLQVIQHDEWM